MPSSSIKITPHPCPLPQGEGGLRIALFASGEGTNCQAICDAIAAGRLQAAVAFVLSDCPTAGALARARQAGIPTVICHPFTTAACLETLRGKAIDLICLAGFMRILASEIVAAYPNRIMNIHPALLPAFPGLHAIRQALAAGVTTTGVTVHFVDAGIDTGPIILQETVPIAPDDTEGSLTEKIHTVEHRLYPHAIQCFADGRIRIEGQKAIVT